MDGRNVQDGRAGGFRGVLKSTSVIGGASALNLLIGMVRTKSVAVLLGPTGVGLLGVYTQVTAVASAVAGMGISQSGVRQVAQAAGSSTAAVISRTAVVLRRVVWLTGGLGMLALGALAVPISRATFRDDTHALAIGLLGIAVLLGQVSAGQACLLQGLRRIGDVALVSVFSSLGATILAIPCYFIWGNEGIVPAILLGASATLAVTWWFARRTGVPAIALSWSEGREEARALVTMGVSFMGASLVSVGSTYLIQALLVRRFEVAGLGIYQAASSLSGVLATFVLGAMAADYYPRLSATAADDSATQTLVDQQSQISTLLALPGLATMLVLAPFVIRLFYAAAFEAAVPILQWCVLGAMGRVISWPLGFVLQAKGRGLLFFATEFVGVTVHVGSVYLFTQLWGLVGAGVALAFVYLFYTAMMQVVVRRLIGVPWSRRTWSLNLLASGVVVLLLLNALLNPHPASRWTIGLLGVAATGWVCLRQVLRRSGYTLAMLAKQVSIWLRSFRGR